MSINIDEDYIDIFLLHNNKKVNSNSPDSLNYYRIITKDIGVKDSFQEINFTLSNNIRMTISIKFKNKFSTQAISVKDRLKFFNQPKQETKKQVENQYIPKKIKMPDFLRKEEEEKNYKKPEIIKKDSSKKVEEQKKNNETKKEELKEKIEEPKNDGEMQKEEETKKIEPKKEQPKKEPIKEETKKEEPKKEEPKKKEPKKEEPKKKEPMKEEPKKKEPKKKEQKKEESMKEEPKKEEIKEEEEPKKEELKTEEPKIEEPKIEEPIEEVKIDESKKEESTNETINKEEQKEETPKEKNIKKDKEINLNLKDNNKEEEENNGNNNIEKEQKLPETPKVIENKIEEKIEIANNKKPPENPKKVKEKTSQAPKPIAKKVTPKIKLEKAETIDNSKIEENFNKNLQKINTFSIPSPKEIAKTKAQTNTSPPEDDDFIVLDIDDLEEATRRNTKTRNGTAQLYLEPKIYSEYLDEQKKKGIKHPYRETFCEGFFISSFPKKEGKVIEMSTSFPAPCGHEECSKLPAMKPEIIFRYPLQDTKTLELNNLAATICFPTGIKVCYDENNGPQNIKDYVTSITNQKGERYYMMTYHFYIKIPSDEYVKQYDENPLKYNLRKFADAYTGLSEEELTEDMMNVIQENLEFSQELGFRDIVFVPFCICLISKYPYVQEMQKCLKSIYTIIKNENNVGSNVLINDLIMYLINSIPIPSKNTKIKFLLPYYNNCIDIDCPKLEDINIMNLSASWLLKYFSTDNLIIIFRLLITEKKILLIDNDYERLSTVADGLVSILYPFQWIHTYIPIMSDQMLKYLETFLPFLNGINESLMNLVEKVFQEGEVQEDDEVFLIYIRENKIKLSSTLKGINKKFEKYIQDNIPLLPSSLEKELRYKIKKAKSELEDIERNKKKNTIENKQNCELQIRDAFIDLFVDMFQDYAKYLSFIEQDPVFNKSLFLEKKSSNEQNFYNEILDTQLFQQFTQNVVNEDVNYFNNKIALNELGKKSKEKKNLKIEKEYFISPQFLNISSHSKDTNFISLVKECKDKYPEDKNSNSSLILEKSIEIKDEKYVNKNCLVYFTPEELEAKNEPKSLVEMEDSELRNPRKMTNSGILQKLKAMNLKAASQVKKKEGPSEKEKDIIKEFIKDYVVKIFKSEEVNLDAKEKTDLLSKLNLPFGREFFISLLSKNSSNIILLKENSSHLLWYLIYMTLISTLKMEETDKILQDIVLLIKCSTYFGIQEEQETKTLFEKNKAKIRDLPKIKQDNFWKKWYDLEIARNEKNKDDIKFKQSIIYEICQTLIQLELPKSMVKNLSDHININEFGKGSELQVQTFKEIIKYITAAKYISVAI